MQRVWHGVWVVCAMLSGSICGARAEGSWQKLERCQFFPGIHSDGDSVEFQHDGQHHVFRLYFVDCIEGTPQSDTRPARQMKYFGLEGEQAATAASELASAAATFTKDQLQKPFTVFTEWQKVDPSGTNPSIRAFIETAAGKDLGTLLVSEGLALIRDTQKSAVDHPGGWTSGRMSAALRLAETEARVQSRGAWGFARMDAVPPGPAPTEVLAASDREKIFACAGKKVSVRGRVAKVSVLPDGRITFIDFLGSPKDGFVGIVRSDFLPLFQEKFPSGLDVALSGREIVLEGVVTLYRNTPQIDLESPSQLRVESEQPEKPSAP